MKMKTKGGRRLLKEAGDLLLLPQGAVVLLVGYYFGVAPASAVFALFVLIHVGVAIVGIWERIDRPRPPPTDDMPGDDGSCT